MKRIILMRHVEAQMAQFGVQDRERPITIQGMYQLESLRIKLKKKFNDVQLALCSNAKRTRQTISDISNLLPTKSEINYHDHLYHAPMTELMQIIKLIDNRIETVLFVGHNPGISEFFHTNATLNPFNHYNKNATFPAGGVAFYHSSVTKWSQIKINLIQLDELIVPDI